MARKRDKSFLVRKSERARRRKRSRKKIECVVFELLCACVRVRMCVPCALSVSTMLVSAAGTRNTREYGLVCPEYLNLVGDPIGFD